MHPRSSLSFLLCALVIGSVTVVIGSVTVVAQAPAHAPPPETPLTPTPAERRTAEAFLAARKAGALSLHAFIERMPKGADLHMHLSGAVYAETYLKDAAEDGLCVDPVKLSFVSSAPLAKTPESVPGPACPQGGVPVASAFQQAPLYDALVDSFSMRGFVPSPGITAHDQFFATFDRFSGLKSRHMGEWLDEVASRAAAQNEQYLEIMHTPSFSHAAMLADRLGWPGPTRYSSPADSSVPDVTAGATPAELAAMREKLLAAGLRQEVETDRAEFADALATRNAIEHCGQPSASAACSVQIRFLYQVLRANSPQHVFAQTLLGFELASIDPDVVGINFVQPEDAYLAMTEYHRQMLMLDYLHSVYPRVHISLHAGELAPGLVPPAGLRFHIREAVDLGHAERIGHGVDVMYETDPYLLLAELAARHVMIEINVTSNESILGVSTNKHSLPAYLAAHVPVAPSTDDEGVARIDLTHEYARVATDFNLDYPALKQMTRTSLEHTFLPGPSLWQTPDLFTHVVPACARQPLGSETPAPACLAYLKASPHAAQQWELEHRFHVFESSL